MDPKNFQKLLESVSRSFALSLIFLPRSERRAVACTYLLARLGDSVTDSGSWSLEDRLAHLEAWENAILRRNPKLWEVRANLGKLPPAEANLVAHGREILEVYAGLRESHQTYAEELIGTLFQGMRFDLRTFSKNPNHEVLYGIPDMQTFEFYCFSVAGCVGRYWVQMFALPQTLEILAIAYGRALQRINILRDVKEDWERGRVYLPQSILEQYELMNQEPWKGRRWKDFVNLYLAENSDLILRGAHFCDALRWKSPRLRWSSAMPLKIGVATLLALSRANTWDARIKISRKEVKHLAIQALFQVLFARSFTPSVRKQLQSLIQRAT